MEKKSSSNIAGYSIGTLTSVFREDLSLNDTELPLVLFLNAFPDFAIPFFEGKKFIIEAKSPYTDWMESTLASRLTDSVYRTKQKNRPKDVIQLLIKGEHLCEHTFNGKTYTIDTFGDRINRTTVDLLAFYDTLKKLGSVEIRPILE